MRYFIFMFFLIGCDIDISASMQKKGKEQCFAEGGRYFTYGGVGSTAHLCTFVNPKEKLDDTKE